MIKFIVAALLFAALLLPHSVLAQECNCYIERVNDQITYSPACDRPAELCTLEVGPNVGNLDLSQFSDLRDVTVYIGNHSSPTFRGITLSSALTQFTLTGGGGGTLLTVIDDKGNARVMGPGAGNNPDGIRRYNLELTRCEGVCTLERPTESAFLPVHLLSWSTKTYDRYVELKWNTVAEEHNAYFRLLHSRNGRSFQELATITGNGTTDIISEYAFRHFEPAVGINFYRIEQVDYDGRVNELGVQSTTWQGGKETALSATPNPARTGSKLTVNLTDADGEVAHLIGPTGRILGEYQISNGGFVLPRLTAGMYAVRVRDRTTQLVIAE
ncbi:hypothetical protein GGR28_002968 [Lewinella aquimaris]|uniref:T9SS type A sorting domain-containing protein n=1 Tax=Neolewinella aquimaris TaxID=1835722 RepID=A0A840E409_9BACT|nr:hypothetical protein [Neolewinella aquimaris]MBB4080334.1 hypothetical protein [Neolewinella aquimaris]